MLPIIVRAGVPPKRSDVASTISTLPAHHTDTLPDWVTEFKAALKDGQLQKAREICSKSNEDICRLSPGDKYAANVVSCVAQLLDRDLALRGTLKHLLDTFETVPRESLPVVDAAHLELAKGILQFHDGNNLSSVIDQLALARTLADLAAEKNLLAISRYYLVRCHCKQGNFGSAVREGRETEDMLDSGKNRVLARIQMNRG